MAKKNTTKYLVIAGLTAFVGVVAYVVIRRRQKQKEESLINPLPISTGGGGYGGGSSYSDKGFPLKKGSGGSKVEALQEYLNDVGDYGLVVDGKFGKNTESAVKEELGNGIKTISETYYNDFVKEYE